MKRLGVLVVLVVLLLNSAPASSGATGNIEEIRQYFELRDTISLMNLEMKRALAPDSQSSLLSEPDAENRLNSFISFIETRIGSFANSDTPLKYHYIKKLNNIFAETRQLHASLAPKLRAAVLAAPAVPKSGVTIVPAPAEQVDDGSGKLHPKPFFDSIGMRTLAPASSAAAVQKPVDPVSRPDAIKTPVVLKPAMPEKVSATVSGADADRAKKVASAKMPTAKEPVKPAAVQKAIAKIEPVKIVAPPAPVVPQKSLEKQNSSVIASAAMIARPVESGKSAEPVKPVELAKTVEQAKTVEPVKAVEPVKPVEPAKTVETEKKPQTSEKPAPTVPEGTGVMRPLAIMIENHNQSRPQSGLDQADVVYEMPVEGGITRFMAIFTRLPGLLGPVRSCREYFVDRALEINALYVHCGGSPLGYAYISKRKINSIDEIAHGKPFFREKTRKAPHNLYSHGKDIYSYMSEKISMRLATQPVLLNYGTRTAPLASDPVVSAKIRYHGNYSLEIKYEDGAYQRYMNDILHVDRDTQKPLRASAVVIQVAAMKTVDAVGRQEISFIGSGTAWVLENGQRTKVTWRKDTPQALTTYKDAAGNDYVFPRDLQVWVQVVSPIHKLFFNGQEEKPAAVAGKPETATPSASIGKQG